MLPPTDGAFRKKQGGQQKVPGNILASAGSLQSAYHALLTGKLPGEAFNDLLGRGKTSRLSAVSVSAGGFVEWIPHGYRGTPIFLPTFPKLSDQTLHHCMQCAHWHCS